MLLTEKLIELVKKYPFLYDMSNDEYKNIRRKDKLWKKLGLEMNENGDQLKKRWKNLRDTYAKHLKANQSTQQNGKKNYKNWNWAREMEHFRPYMSIYTAKRPNQEIENYQDTLFVKTEQLTGSSDCYDMLSEISLENVSSTEEFKESLLNSEINTNCVPNDSRSPSPRSFDVTGSNHIRATEHHMNRHIETINTSSRATDFAQNERIAEMDPIELILLGYAKTIKTFSPQRQAVTKLKFAQIMMEQECEQHNESSSH